MAVVVKCLPSFGKLGLPATDPEMALDSFKGGIFRGRGQKPGQNWAAYGWNLTKSNGH